MNRVSFLVCLAALFFLAPAAGPQNEPLATGFYLVHDEAEVASELEPRDEGERIVVYDYRFLRDKKPTPKYLLVGSKPDVPLSLATQPRLFTSQNGFPALDLELTKASAGVLEEVTGANVGRVAALIIDGDVISTHKIRAKITGGALQITRCTDDACEYIFAKLENE